MLQDFAEKCSRSGSLQLHLMLISHKEISNYIDKLRCIDIPFVGDTYTLVGENYHAKHTTKNHIECVLFAETDNEHDVNAIKVLRWFPKKRSSETMNLSNLFFDLGYISRNENEDLHNFMVNNQSRILFGKIINGKITAIAQNKNIKS